MSNSKKRKLTTFHYGWIVNGLLIINAEIYSLMKTLFNKKFTSKPSAY